MVVFLPIVLLFFVFAVLSGETNMVVMLPTVAVLIGGAFVVRIAMADGQRPKDRSVRTLPTGHLQRQMHRALRPHSASTRRRSDP